MGGGLVEGGGGGRGWGVGGPLRRRRAASPRRPALRPLPPGRPPPPPPSPPSPWQDGKTALDKAKRQKHTEVIKILEKYTPAYLAAQVGRAAPHPPPRRTAPAPCATDRCSRIPGCSLTARSRPITLPQ